MRYSMVVDTRSFDILMFTITGRSMFLGQFDLCDLDTQQQTTLHLSPLFASDGYAMPRYIQWFG